MPEINFNLPVQTKAGKPVTILTTEARGAYPIVGHIGDATTISFWTAEGGHNSSNPHLDLKNLPIQGECWVAEFEAMRVVKPNRADLTDFLGRTTEPPKAIIKLTYSVEPGHNDLED